MVTYGEASDHARRVAQDMVQRFKAEAATVSADSLIAGSRGGVASLGFESGRDAEQQHRHFNGWPYAAISAKARTIAGQPVRVGRKKRKPRRRATRDSLPTHLKGAADQIDVLDDHPLLDVLAKPNRAMTKWHAFYTTVAGLEITGKAHWWITKENGKWVLWPVPAAWIRPKHDDGAFTGWLFRPFGATKEEPLSPEEVVYFYYPDPADPLGVKSPLDATGLAVLADEKIQTSQNELYNDSIFPRMALVAGDISGLQSDESGRPLLQGFQREELVDMIRQHHAGVLRHHEPLILDALISDVKMLSNKPAEMDWMDSGKVTKGRIVQTFGTNPAILGEIEGLNRASSQAAMRHYADFTVNPTLDMMSQVLQCSLAPAFGSRGRNDLVIWIEQYQPDNADARRKDVETLQKGSAINRSESRAQFPALGLSEWTEGGEDVVMGPTDVLVPAKSYDALMRAVNPNHKDAESDNPIPVPPTILSVMMSQALAREPVQHVTTEPTWRTEVKLRWVKAVTRAEAEAEAALVAMFAEQGKEIASRLRASGFKARTPSDGVTAMVDQLFDKAKWDERLKETMRPLLLNAMVAGARSERQLANQQLGVKQTASDPAFIDLDPTTRAKINNELNTIMERDYWNTIQGTVKTDLTSTLQAGIGEGESLHQLAARIEDDAIGMLGGKQSTHRAQRIVRTEMGGAVNAGHWSQQQSLADDGLLEKKQWVSILDFSTRQTETLDHVVMDGESVPVADMFVVANTGERAPYPLYHGLSGGQRIHCRCTSVGVYSAA